MARRGRVDRVRLIKGVSPVGPNARNIANTDLLDTREQAIQAHLDLLKKLVWAVMVLGLALGGKNLLSLSLSVLP